MEAEQNKNIYQLFVRLLDGKTLTLRFNSPTISGETLTQQIQNLTHIPQHHHHNLLLLSEGRHVSSETLISSNDHRLFPTVHVLLRLLGGKGGFGSLLRGAATKAGQKKTNNFDACRDMSGRRLRHVNAEKKLEEWRLEEEGRKLEKVAEDFLKKNAKKTKGTVAGNSAEKYVEKYREVSAKCVAEVEVAVREAIGVGGGGRNGKRKGVIVKKGLDAKRLKIWMGKNKMEESDSDDMDEDGSDNDGDNKETEKSVVLNNGNHSDSSKDVEGTSSSVSCEKLDGESSGGGYFESGTEEEKGMDVQGRLESDASPGVCIDYGEGNRVIEPAVHEVVVQSNSVFCLDAVAVPGTEVVDAECKLGNLQVVFQHQPESISNEEKDLECVTFHHEANGFTEDKTKSEIAEEKAITSTNLDVEKPLNFDDYSSAAEIEVLGMERLKSELQACGLKCGGTLQERAARLFLLKNTPLENLPKKLIAKK